MGPPHLVIHSQDFLSQSRGSNAWSSASLRTLSSYPETGNSPGMNAWKLPVFQRSAELSPSASSRGDEKSPGCISTPRPTSCSLLPGRFPAVGPSHIFLPPWSTVRRARATPDPGTRRGALNWHRTPNTEPGRGFQRGPRPGEAGGLRQRGRGLDSPPTDSSVQGCGPGRGSRELQPPVRFPAEQPRRQGSRGPEDGVSPGAGGGLLARVPTRGPYSQQQALALRGVGAPGVAAPGGKPRGRRLCRRRAPPALGASLPPARAAPRRAAGGGGARPRLGRPRASRRRLSGPGCGSVGAAAADSVLGPREARAGRAPLGPSRDLGGTARSGPEGGGPAAAGAAGFQALAPSPGRALEPGAGTRSRRGRRRAAEGPRGTSSGWWRRGLEATLA